MPEALVTVALLAPAPQSPATQPDWLSEAAVFHSLVFPTDSAANLWAQAGKEVVSLVVEDLIGALSEVLEVVHVALHPILVQ